MNPEKRGAIETRARETVECRYDWDAIAKDQKRTYDRIAGRSFGSGSVSTGRAKVL
jgi:hypothetical protein